MRRDIAENMGEKKIVDAKYSGVGAQEEVAGVCPPHGYRYRENLFF